MKIEDNVCVDKNLFSEKQVKENVINSKVDNEINSIVKDIREFKSLEDMPKINILDEKINNIKTTITHEKNELNNELFNLENILLDFNKLFLTVNKEENIKQNSFVKDNAQNVQVKDNLPVKNNKDFAVLKDNVYLKDLMNNEYILQINYQNINYKVNTIKLEQIDNLNFSNLYVTKVCFNNTINKINLAFELEEHNSSYLFLFMNQKYLINKVNNSIVLTNLLNKNSQIIKNKENFKVGLYDFTLSNNCRLLLPLINKKIFDNSYGTSYNLFIPRI
jgi:hypothetical protein